MRTFTNLGLAVIAVVILFTGIQAGAAKKGAAPKGKPTQQKEEAKWESLGVFAAEDFEDEDDFAAIQDLGDVFLRNYQRFAATKETVLTSKKKLQVEEYESDGKKYLLLYAQEQLGKVEIANKPHREKSEPFTGKLDKVKPGDKTYELFAENDASAPARCYAAGTRVLFPPFPVRSWGQCVSWAQGTGVCRQVEMPMHNPQLSTDGCKCFY